MRFSQKTGKTSVRNSIQIESIDEKLENRLWNTILSHFFNKNRGSSYNYDDDSDEVAVYIYLWTEFFGKRRDEIPTNHNGFITYDKNVKFLKNWFFKSQWYEMYDFLESLSKLDLKYFKLGFTDECNESLKKEMSAYRLVDGFIVQITSEEEIVEIEEALLDSSNWQPVNTHLKTAIEYFSNRENRDYRNSVKESISAIESLCAIITGDSKAKLGPELSIIEKQYQIHGSLKSAFMSLYGYTSDAGGIRHKLLEDDIIVTMEDAKFMLVSCSAFIN